MSAQPLRGIQRTLNEIRCGNVGTCLVDRWPFQPARGTSADLPTRLADGLGLESAPVLRPAPHGPPLRSEWVPRTDPLRNRIRLLVPILRNRKEKVKSMDVSGERTNGCVISF